MIILWKEWRESVRLLPLAMIAVGIMIYAAMPAKMWYITDLATTLSSSMALVSSVYAIVIGLMQTLPEQRSDVRGFLFSMPISRTRLFLAKSMIAFVVHTLAFVIPYGIASYWYISVTPEYRVGDSISLIPGMIAWLGGFAFYPATIWMVSRRARWVGSRTFPLLLSFVATLLISKTYTSTPTLHMLWITVGLLIIVWLFVVATKAYTKLSNQQSRLHSGSTVNVMATLGITTACLLFISFLFGSIFVLAAQPPNSRLSDTLHVDRSGVLFQTRERNISGTQREAGMGKIVAAAPAVAANLTDSYQRPSLKWIPNEKLNKHLKPLKTLTTLSHLGEAARFSPILTNFYASDKGYYWIYHREGYYLLYDDFRGEESSPALHTTFDRNGYDSQDNCFDGPAPQITGARVFVDFPSLSLSSIDVLVDSQGIYQLLGNPGEISTLLETDIQSMIIVPSLVDDGPTAVILGENELRLYDVISVNDPSVLAQATRRNQGGVITQVKVPELALEKRKVIALPESMNRLSERSTYAIADLGEEGFSLIQWTQYRATVLKISSEGNVTDRQSYVLNYANTIDKGVAEGLFPPIFCAIVKMGRSMDSKAAGGTFLSHFGKDGLKLMFAGVLLHIAIAMCVTWLMCKRRVLDNRSTITWMLATVPLGFAASLAVPCVHQYVLAVTCDECGKRKRVDDQTCPHCQADWSRPKQTGIEVFASS